MTAQTPHPDRCPEELRVLTFTLMGVNFAADAEQIAEIMDPGKAEACGFAMHRFHDRLAFGDRTARYLSPKAIKLRNEREPCLILIDSPDDFTTVNVRAIQPMPALIRSRAGSRAVWGAIVDNDSVVLLVDLFRLVASGDRPAVESSGTHQNPREGK